MLLALPELQAQLEQLDCKGFKEFKALRVLPERQVLLELTVQLELQVQLDRLEHKAFKE